VLLNNIALLMGSYIATTSMNAQKHASSMRMTENGL